MQTPKWLIHVHNELHALCRKRYPTDKEKRRMMEISKEYNFHLISDCGKCYPRWRG